MGVADLNGRGGMMADKDTLMDNEGTGTLDPGGNEFLEMSAQVIADAEKGTDDKPLLGEDPPVVEDASSASAKEDEKELEVPETETDVKTLQGVVKGLKKELGRVRDKNRTGSDEAGELREQIARLEGRVDEQSKSTGEKATAKFNTEDLPDMQTDWEDVLLDARVTLASAKGSEDTQLIQQSEERVAKARGQIAAIRKEIQVRAKADAEQKAVDASAADVALDQTVVLIKEFTDVHPDVLEKGTDHWKAASAFWTEHKDVLGSQGALGELIAGLMTAPKGDKAAKSVRKDLLKDLDDTATKSLLKGTPAGSPKTDVDFESLLHKPGGFQTFEAIRNKVVSGG